MYSKRNVIAFTAIAWLAALGTGWAFDQIHVLGKDGAKDKKTIVGQITSISPQEVVIEQNSIARQVPVNEIKYIQFDDEPTQLFNARKQIIDAEYGDALTSLEKIQAKEIKREQIGQEVEYMKAFCEAHLAIGGSMPAEEGKNPLVEAGRKLINFLNANPKTYHLYEASELVGDLLVTNGNFDRAEPYFAALSKAPWPDYKMRAGVAMGRALLAQGKTAEAAKAFEDVLANGDAVGELAEGQRQAATLGKARCLAAGGKPDQAVKIIEDVIAKADPDNLDLHAQAYNALGAALRKSKKPKDALLAFLHTDLLYSLSPDAHAEALANLEVLFNELHKPDHARRVRQTLDERYKNSRWAGGVR